MSPYSYGLIKHESDRKSNAILPAAARRAVTMVSTQQDDRSSLPSSGWERPYLAHRAVFGTMLHTVEHWFRSVREIE